MTQLRVSGFKGQRGIRGVGLNRIQGTRDLGRAVELVGFQGFFFQYNTKLVNVVSLKFLASSPLYGFRDCRAKNYVN